MQKTGRDPQVLVDQETYEFIVQEAKRHKRTIKGQVEHMIDLAKKIELQTQES